jgi:hypothetical protein
LDEWRLYGNYITAQPRKIEADNREAVIGTDAITVAEPVAK